MKIWAKVMNKDKILRDVLIEESDTKYYTFAEFKKLMQQLCYPLDVSTPVLLQSHYQHFIRFNRVKFIPRDFIETIDFTSLVVETAIEKKEKQETNWF